MKAIIMAGGEGSRLRPLTCGIPKPMVPVMNRPIMEYSIELLKKYGILDIGVTLQYIPDRIMEYFEDGKQWNVKLQYFTEQTPLGTAGSIKNAESFLDETFIVMSGDALTDINIQEAIEFHKNNHAMVTLVTKKVQIPLEYGVIITDPEQRIKQFLEKPGWGEVFSDTVNTGIYILEPEVLNYFNKGQVFDFSKDLFPLLLKQKKPMFGYTTLGYWCDIGDLQQYLQAHYDALGGKIKMDFKSINIGDNRWVASNTKIGEYILHGPCMIGSDTELESGAIIEPYTVIGNQCFIRSGSSIKRSVLWDRVTVGLKSQLRGTVLCNGSHLHEEVSLFEDSVIGESTIIGKHCIVKPGIKVWPGKTIEDHAVVDCHLIWSEKKAKAIFCNNIIQGVINRDLTPELLIALAASYGASISEHSQITIACSMDNGAFMLKEAMKIGLLSEGKEVFDFGFVSTPMTRYGIRYFGLQGGIHIGIADDDPEIAVIEIMDQNGANINRNLERKIENLFSRQDFKRAPVNQVPKCTRISNLSLFYTMNIVNSIDTDLIGKHKLKILVTGHTVDMISQMGSILRRIGCDVQEMDPILNRKEQITTFSQIVKQSQSDIGLLMDRNGERVILFDENGVVIQEELFIALISLVTAKSQKQPCVVVPLHAPMVIEKMTEQYKGKVIRTKTSKQSIMEGLFDCEREERNSRISMFNLYFDGLASTVIIIEAICKWNTTLAGLLKDIPNFYMKNSIVDCSWDDKGKVIRSLIENEKQGHVELLEGIKVIHNDKGWTLILPDADAPLCRVYSEGFTEEFADSLTDLYIKKIEEIKSQK